MKGTTSVAPMRGCAPLCLVRSIFSRAHAIPAKAASTARSTEPVGKKQAKLENKRKDLAALYALHAEDEAKVAAAKRAEAEAEGVKLIEGRMFEQVVFS